MAARAAPALADSPFLSSISAAVSLALNCDQNKAVRVGELECSIQVGASRRRLA